MIRSCLLGADSVVQPAPVQAVAVVSGHCTVRLYHRPWPRGSTSTTRYPASDLAVKWRARDCPSTGCSFLLDADGWSGRVRLSMLHQPVPMGNTQPHLLYHHLSPRARGPEAIMTPLGGRRLWGSRAWAGGIPVSSEWPLTLLMAAQASIRLRSVRAAFTVDCPSLRPAALLRPINLTGLKYLTAPASFSAIAVDTPSRWLRRAAHPTDELPPGQPAEGWRGPHQVLNDDYSESGF